jgi:hypothetical protein
MLGFWDQKDLDLLQDEIMKAQATDEMEKLQGEFEVLLSIYNEHSECMP